MLLTYDEMRHLERVIEVTYGDSVSFKNKGKLLNKFGRNAAVGTSYETVAEFQGTTANETFVSTNIIDSISSSAAGDTSLTITIEGHTIDASGNLTFVVQNATTDASDGRTKVALTTPLARANRAYVANSGTFDSPQTLPAGIIYIYDDTDGITLGVPNTAAATKLTISAGESRTEKAATSISQNDYFAICSFGAGIGNAGASANRVTVRMETRDVKNGGVWQPMGRDIVLIPGQNGMEIPLHPCLIVPKNHDWRISAKTDTNTAEIFAEASGAIATLRG